MPKPTMAQVRGLGDFAPLYQWDMSFITSPQGIDLSDEGMNVRATSSGVPKKTTQPIDINIRNHHIQRPGIQDSDHAIALNFMETVDSYIVTRLNEWQKLCQENDSGNQSNYEDIACDLRIQRMDRQGNPIWEYKLIGCWLTEFDSTGGDIGSENEVARPVMNLVYDDFEEGAPGTLS